MLVFTSQDAQSSGQLANPFRSMSLGSQSQEVERQGFKRDLDRDVVGGRALAESDEDDCAALGTQADPAEEAGGGREVPPARQWPPRRPLSVDIPDDCTGGALHYGGTQNGSGTQPGCTPTCTPDFITPVEAQFEAIGDGGGGGDGARPGLRSPAALSPARGKRARRAGLEGAGGAAGRGAGGPGPGARRVPRPRSPPCYRSAYGDAEAEEGRYARWTAPAAGADGPSLWGRDAAERATLGGGACGVEPAPPPSRYRLDYREIGLLGQGSFSRAYRARHRLDGREYAVKRTTRAVVRASSEFASFLGEVQALASLPPHPNVVGYRGAWVEPAPGGAPGALHAYCVLELCEASLSAHLALSGPDAAAPATLVGELLRQVAGALAHMHAHGVAHCDVKPENIYVVGGVCAEGPPPPGPPAGGPGASDPADGSRDAPRPTACPTFKLGDLGHACRLGRTPEGASPPGCEGDARYVPFEVLNDDRRDLRAADVFSLGASALELAWGRELPRGGNEYRDLRTGRLPLLPALPAPIARLLARMMASDPKDRPSAATVAAHSSLRRA